MLNKGDIITLDTTLPTQFVENPILKIYNIHSAITVKIDGEIVYTYGQDLYEAGKAVGYIIACT